MANIVSNISFVVDNSSEPPVTFPSNEVVTRIDDVIEPIITNFTPKFPNGGCSSVPPLFCFDGINSKTHDNCEKMDCLCKRKRKNDCILMCISKFLK